MIQKKYIGAQELLHDSFLLARRIYDTGYRPDVLVVLWRGGSPVGMAIHEFLLYKGIETKHVILKAASYAGIERRTGVHIEHAEYLLGVIEPHHDVLVIDDIFDSGCTIQAIRSLVLQRAARMMSATLYFKPSHNQPELHPDFYLRTTEEWVVFPHELVDLSLDEIKTKDRFIYDLMVENDIPAPPGEV